MKSLQKKARQFYNRHRQQIVYIAIPFLFAMFFFSVTLHSTQYKSNIYDEGSHLIRGTMLLETGDFRLNQHHPYLFNAWAAIPMLFDDDIKHEGTNSENWAEADKDGMHWHMIRLSGGETQFTKAVLPWARVMMIISSVAFLVAFYFIVMRIFNFPVALIATAFLAVNPTFLAHGRLVTTDIPAVSTIFLASAALYGYFNAKPKHRLKMFGLFILASLVALISKYTATMVAFIWVVLIFGFHFWPNLNRQSFWKNLWQGIKWSLVTVGLWIILLTAAYGFQFQTFKETDYARQAKTNAMYGRIEEVSPWLDDHMPWDDNEGKLRWAYNHVKLPFPWYIRGFTDNVVVHNFYWHTYFLLGDYSEDGWWYYFPVAFVFKEPITFTVGTLVAGGYFMVVWIRRGKQKKRVLPFSYAYTPFIITPLFMLFLNLNSSINFGVRHLIPLYPFMFIMIGLFLYRMLQGSHRKIWLWITIVGILFMYGSVLRVHPHYLTYFPEFIGSPANGHKFLHDSNFDWGQNKLLRDDYAEEHKGDGEVISLGQRTVYLKDPSYIIIPAEKLFDHRHWRYEQWLLDVQEAYKNGEAEKIDIIAYTHWVLKVDRELVEEKMVEQ